MTAVLIVAGSVLIAVALLDAIATAATAGRGGGPLTRQVGRLLWALMLPRGPGHRLLPLAGPVVLLSTLGVWVLLNWLGWTMVFSSAPGAVVSADSGEPADLPGRVYYAGFVVFTLGVGDLVPGSDVWQVLTAVATFLGLFLVTMSITYLVTVVGAAVSRRRLALSVSLLGETGPDVVLLHWRDGQLHKLAESRFDTLSRDMLQVAQQHLAYPVLHYFYSAQPEASTPHALAVLDDALLLLETAVAPGSRPGPAVTQPLRGALEHYTTTVGTGAGEDADPAPLPPLDALRAAGVPLVDDACYRAAAQEHAARRKAMHRLVRSDGREWPDTTC